MHPPGAIPGAALGAGSRQSLYIRSIAWLAVVRLLLSQALLAFHII
jgi:hypothetical protein